MKLFGSLSDKNGKCHFREHLCTFDVIEDNAEPIPPYYFRRRVNGRVVEYGILWDHFVDTWVRGKVPFLKDSLLGGRYYWNPGMVVDRDHYASGCGFNFDKAGNVYLWLIETFSGTTNEYYAEILKRNEGAVKWDIPTGNDYREAMGLLRLDYPHLEKPITGDVLKYWLMDRKRFNCIV